MQKQLKVGVEEAGMVKSLKVWVLRLQPQQITLQASQTINNKLFKIYN